MSRATYLSAFAVLPLVLLSACSTPNGQPQKGSEPVAPNQVVDFGTLYAQNCAACHGAEGRGGASIALANPVYLAIVDKNAMHRVVASGVRGTSMPAFAQSAGGSLRDEQINVITSGMLSHWGHKGSLDGTNPPSYAAKTEGNVDHGELAFGTYCASCHGTEGKGTA
jgi:mono/diheme cytochrome c family protein